MVGLVLVVITGVAVAGWVVGSRVQTSDTAAAKAAPPDPSLITAPVELRVLSSQVVDRGDVVPGRSADVTGPATGENEAATVTAVFAAVGDELAEGNPIVEVSGRPVIVFEGAVPAYRDMKPGMRGADVEQLRDALGRVGCDTDADDPGVYGDATEECVALMYDSLGYETVASSEDEATNLTEARNAVADATDVLGQAQAALDVLLEPKPSEVAEKEAALASAQRKVTEAAAAGTEGIEAAEAAVEAAVAKLNAKLADRASTPADRATELAALEEAARDLAAAERKAVEDNALAAEEVATAQAAVEELTSPDVDAETDAVTRAQGAVERAEAALAELEAASGPIVPLGEIVYVDALPATVSSMRAKIGGAVQSQGFDGSSEPLAVLATAGLRVEALISPSDAELLTGGLEVELLDDGQSGDVVVGAVVSIGDQILNNENDRGIPVVVEANEPIPREWTGRNVRLTFTGASTVDEVLVVPAAALSSGAGGEARVEVLADDGTVTPVPVEPGLSADGFVEVEPLDGATLDAGDLVVVGDRA